MTCNVSSIFRATAVATTGLLALTLGGLAPAASSAAPAVAERSAVAQQSAAANARRTGGTLSYSPRHFIGGQAITFRGKLPAAGVRRISLQQHMNRPGDAWFARPGFQGTTAPDGSFEFAFPAPAMYNIRFRVVAQGLATTPVNLTAKTQDLLLLPSQGQYGWDVAVDTTPGGAVALRGRPDVQGAPTFPGRRLTLQRRDPETFAWTTVGDDATTGKDGMGHFRGVSQGWYRVIQGAVTKGANRIAWFPSFPTWVGPQRASRTAAATNASSRQVQTHGGTRATSTAASRYKWGRALFDFGWTNAEALDAAPQGTNPRGHWEDYSNGTGRAAHLNGGLALESGRERNAGDHHGTTEATLRGNARAYGRWETRLRESVTGRGGAGYRYLIQLVPESTGRGRCSDDTITIANVPAGGGTMSFGARNGSTRWTGSTRIGSVAHSVPALAVEVTPKHITWFLNSRPVGSVVNSGAISSAAKTLRFSLVGDGDRGMRSTFIQSDWQRGYDLGGRQTIGGKRLSPSSAPGGC